MERREVPPALDAVSLPAALTALGQLLVARGLSYEAVAIGGSALLLMGYITRATRDLDVIAVMASGQPRPLSSLLPRSQRRSEIPHAPSV